MRSEGRDIQYDIAFGGQFCHDYCHQYGMEINNNTVNEFIKIGYDIIRKAENRSAAKVHQVDIASIDAIEFMASRAGKMQMSETWSHPVICRRTTLLWDRNKREPACIAGKKTGMYRNYERHACTKPVR